MTRDAGAAMTATIRTSGRYGVHMGAELRVLLIALVFLVATDVCCITTANAQASGPEPQPGVENFTIFQQFEADALNAVLKNWTSGELNQQLSSILRWSPQQHPCNTSAETVYDYYGDYGGAWRGVVCRSRLQEGNSTGNYHIVSVIKLTLYGSNMSCDGDGEASSTIGDQCGFEGIQGVLLSEISLLTNLFYIYFSHHPKLTGAVPLQIWQMPKLTFLDLSNNSLQGTLPSSLSLSSTLEELDLSRNQFSGVLEVSSNGTLFSSSLSALDLSFNHMFGQVNFQQLSKMDPYFQSIYLQDNNFNGTFSIGPYFNPRYLNLSNNFFTSIKISNYSGNDSRQGLSTSYMPYLLLFSASGNRLGGSFPKEFLSMPELMHLDLSGNFLEGLFPSEVVSNVSHVDVSRNRFIGSLDFQRTIRDNHNPPLSLNFSHNLFNGNFSTGSYLNPRLLDLSHNNFKHINFDLFNGTRDTCMPFLEKLYMVNISASGVFPINILRAPSLYALYADHNQFNVLQLPFVKFGNFNFFSYGFGIFLTNNNIEKVDFPSEGGSPLSSYNLQFSNYLFLAGNPYCKNVDTSLLFAICRMNQTDDRPLSNGLRSFSKNTKAIIASTTSIFGLILFLICIYLWRLIHRVHSLGQILKEFDKREVKPNLYSYKDIKLATKNFDERNKLGEGGFGVVYKGVLSDGSIVAVKRLTMSSSQILSEFLNEVVVISGLIHRNLVKLKGCCLGDGDQRILVFEYVENKNLAEALSFSDNEEKSFEPTYLDWASRFNIIVGIARGLAYLHEDLQSPVIHRDIKATNILLDKDYNPKIADFGLAFLFPTLKNNESHLTIEQVAGTRGYCAPEYVLHGHMSTTLDVYSFGILVLEIICGRKNIDLRKIGEEVILQEWAWKMFEAQNTIMLIDPRMKHSSLDVEAITRVINVALACVQFKAALRPKMHEVGHMLLGNMSINKIHEHSNGVALSFSMGSNAMSSWKNNDVSIDELSLLSNPHEIEMIRSN